VIAHQKFGAKVLQFFTDILSEDIINERKSGSMKTKFLIYAAITFLILGLRLHDGELYYFFAVYLAALALGVCHHRWRTKYARKMG